MTFSIVARSTDGESWGVAVASKFLAVGAVVPAAVAGVGAVATQADANVAYKGLALSHLDEGATASVALQRLLEEDEGRDDRQVGLVDRDGGAATHTGHACLDWAGGVIGPDGSGYAIQGNILAAALLVVRDGAGYAGGDDIAVDLRVDDHADPVTELARLLDLNDLYLTASTEAEQVTITDELHAEIDRRVHELGFDDLAGWAGTENYEMRVDPGGAWIDQQILDRLRDATPNTP
jgi:uncharacterized Ntn-hydrolase superfamily protein